MGDGERGGWEGSPDLGDTSELARGQREGQKFPVTGCRTALGTFGCCHRQADLQPGLPRESLGCAGAMRSRTTAGTPCIRSCAAPGDAVKRGPR